MNCYSRIFQAQGLIEKLGIFIPFNILATDNIDIHSHAEARDTRICTNMYQIEENLSIRPIPFV